MATPAGIPQASAAQEPMPPSAISVDRELFDLTPPALPSIFTSGVTEAPTRPAESLAALDRALRIDLAAGAGAPSAPQQDVEPTGTTVATADSDSAVTAEQHLDPVLLLEFLTFPYHNVYAIGTSVGAALNSVVLTALLPVTIGYYVLNNQIDLIEPYIETTLHNLRNAVPNIFTTIRNEIAYDINLFNQIFDVTPEPVEDLPDTLPPANSAELPAHIDPAVPDHGLAKDDAAHDIPDADVDESPDTVDDEPAAESHAPDNEDTPSEGKGGRHRVPDEPAAAEEQTPAAPRDDDTSDQGGSGQTNNDQPQKHSGATT